jgi:hypothetical protein
VVWLKPGDLCHFCHWSPGRRHAILWTMSGYELVRLVHGYWRWMVLASGLVVLARAIAGLRGTARWTPVDERAAKIFVAAVDVQVLLGLVLYFGLSPFFQAVHQSFHASMKDPITRFFGIEHETAMVIAFVAAHVGRVRARRAIDPRRKQRATLVSLIVFFVVVAWAIPWPWRAVGRPLFR